MNHCINFYLLTFLIFPFFYCNGMQRLKGKGRALTTSIFTRLSQQHSLNFVRYGNEHEVTVPDEKLHVCLLDKFNNKSNDMQHAQHDVYETHLKQYEAFNDSLEKNAAQGVFGFISLVGYINISAGAPAAASLLGFMAVSSFYLLSPYIYNSLILYKSIQKHKEAKSRYKELYVEYAELAQKLNKPLIYNLDNIDLDKFDLHKKIKSTSQCIQCNKKDEEICDCACSPKKINKKIYTSYELVKK